MNITCCICTENVIVHPGGVRRADSANDHPCTIPCGHVFHSGCLRSWLRQSISVGTCPQCRARCFTSEIIKLYLIDETPPNKGQSNGLTQELAIVCLTKEISQLEYKLKQDSIANRSIVNRLEQELAQAAEAKKDLERKWCSEKQGLLQSLQDTTQKLQKYEEASAAAAARQPVSRCNNKRCTGTVPERIICLQHSTCNDQCRVGIKGMSVLSKSANGGVFCKACVPFKCFYCRQKLSGKCAKYRGKIVHLRCVPCFPF